MADQYQNFSNPTIVPEQRYGWQSANQSAQGAGAGLADYLIKQQSAVQGLQLQQAQDLSKFKTLDQIYYGGQHSPMIDQILAQNPYGKRLVSQNMGQSLGSQDQSNMMGNPAAGASMIGVNTGNQFTGNSVLPNALGAMGGNSGSAAVQPGGNVVTGGSMTQKAFEPPSFTQSVTNIPAEAAVQGAKAYSGKAAENQAGATESETRDIQQLAMVKNAIKPLVDSYNTVYNGSVGGVLPAAGDAYGSNVVKHADLIPRGMQNSIISPEIQKASGQFLANKNELVTKLQPLLSQQFGKEGSSRIMETLIKMSQQEIGDLSTPKEQFQGQITGTLSSLYRIAKASQAYAQDLAKSGQPSPDPETAAKEIASRMSLQTLLGGEQKELQGMIDDVVGKQPKTGADLNPLSNAKPQTKQLDQNTASQILSQTGGDKNKARQLAKQMGYSF